MHNGAAELKRIAASRSISWQLVVQESDDPWDLATSYRFMNPGGASVCIGIAGVVEEIHRLPVLRTPALHSDFTAELLSAATRRGYQLSITSTCNGDAGKESRHHDSPKWAFTEYEKPSFSLSRPLATDLTMQIFVEGSASFYLRLEAAMNGSKLDCVTYALVRLCGCHSCIGELILGETYRSYDYGGWPPSMHSFRYLGWLHSSDNPEPEHLEFKVVTTKCLGTAEKSGGRPESIVREGTKTGNLTSNTEVSRARTKANGAEDAAKGLKNRLPFSVPLRWIRRT